jgi:hypothetical protein
MLKASAFIVVFFFSITLPQFKHFHPSKLTEWLKNDCITIIPVHFGHFIERVLPHIERHPVLNARQTNSWLGQNRAC